MFFSASPALSVSVYNSFKSPGRFLYLKAEKVKPVTFLAPSASSFRSVPACVPPFESLITSSTPFKPLIKFVQLFPAEAFSTFAAPDIAPIASLLSVTLAFLISLSTPNRASASALVSLILSIFPCVCRSMAAKSSRTVVCLVAGINRDSMSFSPLIASLTTGRSTDPMVVFRLSKLLCNSLNPLANPSEVLAKSPCASEVACIRY